MPSEIIMHAKIPFTRALILVLAPFAVSVLLALIYRFYFKIKTLKKDENLPGSHRRDDIQSILLILSIAALTSAISVLG